MYFQVKNDPTFWVFIKKTVLANLYWVSLDNGEFVTDYDQQFLADMGGFRLGQPRLRQLRVEPGRVILLHCTVSSIDVPKRAPKEQTIVNGRSSCFIGHLMHTYTSVWLCNVIKFVLVIFQFTKLYTVSTMRSTWCISVFSVYGCTCAII